MAFSFTNTGSASPFGGSPAPSGGTNIQEGLELQEIQTTALGFKAISGDAKLRLLPTAWSNDALPPPTVSLLAIAPTKGYLAAAGPDALIFTTTDKVREALRAETKADNNVKPFEPSTRVSTPKLSQVAFSAEENVLLVSAQDNGGIIAYRSEALRNGQTHPELQISTDNTPLRVLLANPAPESAELVAAVTTAGDLLMADLKSSQLRAGPNGPVLRSGVSCVSWSNKGKQLVAGLADGNVVQMKPDGSVVAEIPKPGSVAGNSHVSGISWLENDMFLIIYTPNNSSSDGTMPSSDYFIVSRQKGTSNFTFQKLPEVCPPYGMERMPTTHFITRLRNFQPVLQDLLILSATTSPDIGLISKADKPLSEEEPVTEAFTLTTITDDSRRAQIPLSESMNDTSVVGVGLDLSSTELVSAPIPSDPEIESSATPLPEFFILNHEGVLASWWIIHNASIQAKSAYSGMASSTPIEHDMQATATSTPSMQSPMPVSNSTFGQSGFSATPFAKPATTSFGMTSTPSNTISSSAFGQTSSMPAFGQSTSIGDAKSSWTNTGFGASQPQSTASGFGAPSFGSTSTPATSAAATFGGRSMLGAGGSAFGKSSTANAPTFGSTSSASPFTNGSNASPFASNSGTSGFSSFANTNGTSAFASSAQNNGGSIFGKPPTSTISENSSNIFGAKSGSVFSSGEQATKPSIFGNSGFKIESSFKADSTPNDDRPSSRNTNFPSLDNFGLPSVNKTSSLAATHDKEAEMEDDDEPTPPANNDAGNKLSMITPPSTLIHHKQTPAPPLSGLFGPSNNDQSTPPAPNTSTAWSFGNLPSTTPKDTPDPSKLTMFGTKTAPETSPAAVQKSEPAPLFGRKSEASKDKYDEGPKIKEEPPSDDDSAVLENIPEAPLPPDPVSKTTYSPGDTSISSDNSKQAIDDDPLPPDFLPANKSAVDEAAAPQLPDDDDDFSSDFEGSTEDATGEISPIEDQSGEATEQLLTSPESSFGKDDTKDAEESPTGGLFTKVNASSKSSSRPLFGEIGSTQFFPPPVPQESPRSPSPIRASRSPQLLRPEAPRSFSAPGRPPVLDRRKAQLAKSPLAVQAVHERELEAARESARTEALARAKAEAEAQVARELQYDENEDLRKELAAPLEAKEQLELFLPYSFDESSTTPKAGVPGQIERLHQDLESMINNVGINLRSLSGFMLYQKDHKVDLDWPGVLTSEDMEEALDTKWDLSDISRLHEGSTALQDRLRTLQIQDFADKIKQCQSLLAQDLIELRSKINQMRKSTRVQSDPTLTTSAPLSAAQASLQNDLRKSATGVQIKLSELEQKVAILRAKLAETASVSSNHSSVSDLRSSRLGRSGSHKKPTIEAVTNTISKLTAMAESKSADVDILEAKIRKLGLDTTSRKDSSPSPYGTPNGRASAMVLRTSTSSTPGGKSIKSVYHTPESKFGGSARTTPAKNGDGKIMVSAEDRERWMKRARREKKMRDLVKEVIGGIADKPAS